jgi:hypothetical protein
MPELHIRISDDTHQRLNKVLPWGAKQAVMETVIQGVLELLEREHGQIYLGMLMNGDVTLIDVLRNMENNDPRLQDS